MSEEELVAESDKSPGVLVSSGYIAGGAIAGILVLFVQNVMTSTDTKIADWATAHNPFFAGPHEDVLSLLPYALLCLFLFLVARSILLAPRRHA